MPESGYCQGYRAGLAEALRVASGESSATRIVERLRAHESTLWAAERIPVEGNTDEEEGRALYEKAPAMQQDDRWDLIAAYKRKAWIETYRFVRDRVLAGQLDEWGLEAQIIEEKKTIEAWRPVVAAACAAVAEQERGYRAREHGDTVTHRAFDIVKAAVVALAPEHRLPPEKKSDD